MTLRRSSLQITPIPCAAQASAAVAYRLSGVRLDTARRTAVLIVFSLMTVGLINTIVTDSIPMLVRILVLTLIAAAIVHSMIRAWGAFNVVNRARKQGEAVSLAQASGDNRTYRQRRRASAGGAGLGALAWAGSAAAGGLLVISVIFNFGWGVVLFLASFQRYFSPEEFQAVEQITRQQRREG